MSINNCLHDKLPHHEGVIIKIPPKCGGNRRGNI